MDETSEPNERVVNIKDYRDKLVKAANFFSPLHTSSERFHLQLLGLLKRCCTEPSRQDVLITPGADGELGYVFTRWFLGKLLVVFITPTLSKLHGEYVTLNLDVLQLFESHNPRYFRKLVRCYLGLLHEITAVVKSQHKFPVQLTSFTLEESAAAPQLDPLLVESLVQLSSLQGSVTNVFSKLVKETALFAWDMTNELCSILAGHALYGREALLSSSLSCLVTLLEHSNIWMKPEVVDDIVQCLCKVVAWLPKLELDGSTGIQRSGLEEIVVQLLRNLCKPEMALSACSAAQLGLLVEDLIGNEHFNPALLSCLSFLMKKLFRECGTAFLPKFTLTTWLRLLRLSENATAALCTWAEAQAVIPEQADALDDAESLPGGKKKAIQGLLVDQLSTLQEQMRLHLKAGYNAVREDSVDSITVATRLCLVGMELAMRPKSPSCPWLTEKDYEDLNRLLKTALTEAMAQRQLKKLGVLFDRLVEYLEKCVRVAQANLVGNSVLTEWINLAAIPFSWLSATGPDEQLKQLSIQCKSLNIPKLESLFLPIFIKFPASSYKPWAIDLILELLKKNLDQDVNFELIRGLPWMVRLIGRGSSKDVTQFCTKILNSDSGELIAQLVEVFPSVVCSFSGKLTLRENMQLTCTVCSDETSSAKMNSISNDVVDVSLTLVFTVLATPWVEVRPRLFQSVLTHTQLCESVRNTVMARLESVLLLENLALEHVLVRCAVIAVRFLGESVVQRLMKILLTVVSRNCDATVAAWVERAIRQVAGILSITTEQLYANTVAAVSTVVLSQKDAGKGWNLIALLAQLFQLQNTEDALSKLLPDLLPRLIMKANTDRELPLLEEISVTLKQRTRELIIRRFPYIYVHLLHYASDSEQSAAFRLIEEETRHRINDLKSSTFQVIHNELLCRLRSCKTQVLRALHQFASEDEKFSCSQKNKDLNVLANYLQPRFLGILVHFDEKLQSHNAPENCKAEVLASLTELLNIMGPKHVTNVRLKVLATIRTAMSLQGTSCAPLLASLWDAFMRNIQLEELGPLVTQIVVSLLPLYSDCAEQVRSMLYFLVVENKTLLADHLKHLYFFPELPGLEDITYAVTLASKEEDFRSRLLRLVDNITHEDYDTRLTNLRYLKKQLEQNLTATQQLVMNDGEVLDPVVSQLISALLEACRVREDSNLSIAGQCFGQLGAIDPGLLNFDRSLKSDATVCTDKVMDEAFVLHVLTTLGRSFLAPRDVHTLNSCSFTIQEILKVHHPEKSNSSVWAKLPEQLRIAFTPLLTSRYILRQRNEDAGLPNPIYKSIQCCDYSSWLYLWTCSMINRVKNSDAQAVFTPSKQVMRRDVNFNLMLLPYVAIIALWDSDRDQHDAMLREVMHVLSDGQNSPVPTLSFKRNSSDKSLVTTLAERESADSDLFQSGVQAVFYLIDFMNKWLSTVQVKSALYEKVEHFVSAIPNVLLAQAAYKCRAYSRALLHLELLIEKIKGQLDEHLGFLQKIYVALDEPDGVAGVCAIRDYEPTLDEHISAYRANGRLQDALSCYERITRQEDSSPEVYQGMLRCLLDLDMPHAALNIANSLREANPVCKSQLDDYRAECCWRLGQWDLLDSLVSTEEANVASSWGIGLGRTLLAAKEAKFDLMEQHADKVRVNQMRVISAYSMDRSSYSRAYQNLIKLHCLAETEAVAALLKAGSQEELEKSFRSLLNQWESRLKLIQTSIRSVEPILHMRRVILTLVEEQVRGKHPQLAASIAAEISRNILTNARFARKAGHHQRAQTLLVACSGSNAPGTVYIEQAKLHWVRGEQDQAITVLRRGLGKRSSLVSPMASSASDWSQNPLLLEHLKAKLLLTQYYEKSGNADIDSIMKGYKEVVELGKTWEDGYFYLARYHDHLWNNLPEKENRGDLAQYVIINFGRSLQYGNKHIYHSLPRLLELWFEVGTMSQEAGGATSSRARIDKARMGKINTGLKSSFDTVPAYKLLTAFPQLISRICHPHPDVATRLRELIAKIVVSHPQQTMWMMVAVLRSSYKMRAKKCQEIVNQATGSRPELAKFFTDALELAKSLVDVANHPAGNGVLTLSISKMIRKLPRLLASPDFSRIMIPSEYSMTVALPTTPGPHLDHNAFPKEPVYITGIEETVEVMPSLQKPKKVTFCGSDGKRYVFLCKPKDDLRKDCRLMDFNKLINRFLVRDPEARKRNLHIRTYAVVPLNEECGLIQWISNLHGLRHIVLNLYKKNEVNFSFPDLKKVAPHLRDSIEKKKLIFEKQILPKYPPVFKQWFQATFPEPQAWYMARLNFIRTTAVMSMVGFVVGLGDRHGENILLDAQCGDTVHVDFNCLFNKGETFEWPEVVPFRLTQNMVDAMGPTGVEGSLRKCSEVTLRILRDQADTLLNVLKPFIHDPLVEWSKAGEGSKESGEIKNEKALEHVGNIERRLQGYLNSKSSKSKIVSLPLSVEGQVNQLIAEAMNNANLAQMYIGWNAFI